MTGDEVVEWIGSLFGQLSDPNIKSGYMAEFRRVGVDGEMLCDFLDDHTLATDIGIAVALHRRKIISKRDELVVRGFPLPVTV